MPSSNCCASAKISTPGYRIQSHRPVFGFFIDSIKRLIHWGSRPYTDAVHNRQEAFNEAVLQAMREVAVQFESNIHRLDDHKAYLESFHKAIHDLQQTDGELAPAHQ